MTTRAIHSLSFVLFFSVWGSAVAQTLAAQPASEPIEPKCSGAWKLEGDKCVADGSVFDALKEQACQAARLVWDKAAQKCARGAAPAPSCGNAITDLALENGKCVIKRTIARSAPGDYVGDCFKIVAQPKGTDLVPDKTYLVISQSIAGEDRALKTVEARQRDFPQFRCSPVADGVHAVHPVLASSLSDAGAIRTGWTYGMLALPYKYHLDDKSFSSSVSIGPYIGRRIETFGSGFTLAATAALGSVTGTITGADGKTTNPTLAAFTFAAGVMYDVNKGSGKAFKAGIFVGRDIVGSDSAASYVHNRKNWFALQLGYDFTDN